MINTKKQKVKKTFVKMSVIAITKNEEKKLPDCLRSIKWADEIIIIDTGSVDQTVKIAKDYTDNIFNISYGSYDTWRNEGLKRATGTWVLYIDADERVTPSLHEEIVKVISDTKNQFGWYVIPRKNIILGKELKHGGWWPDYVKRLFVRGKLKGWKGELHEEPMAEGGMGYLKSPILHIKHNDLSEMVEKTNTWSGVEAKLMFAAGHPPMNVVRFISAMFREFWLRMVRNKAFMDGTVGIIYALYQTFSKFISYAKLWEMQLKKNMK